MSRRGHILSACAISVWLLTVVTWLAHHAPVHGGSCTPKMRDVIDMTGQRTGVPLDPRHILSLCTSATDTMVRMGAADRLVAIDAYGRAIAGTEQVEVIGKGSAVSQEVVLSRGIDLAFLWWYQDDAAAMLERLSVPVVRIRSARAAETPAMIRLVGECLGCMEHAEREASRVEGFLESAVAGAPEGRAERPRVYFEMYGAYKTVGRETYSDDLIRLAGGDNVAAATTGSVLLSAERLVECDPDVVLLIEGFGDAATVAARPGLAGLRAIRQGRVVSLERRWLVAGPALPEAAAHLRALLNETASDQGVVMAFP